MIARGARQWGTGVASSAAGSDASKTVPQGPARTSSAPAVGNGAFTYIPEASAILAANLWGQNQTVPVALQAQIREAVGYNQSLGEFLR
jgi:hypothetical protein